MTSFIYPTECHCWHLLDLFLHLSYIRDANERPWPMPVLHRKYKVLLISRQKLSLSPSPSFHSRCLCRPDVAHSHKLRQSCGCLATRKARSPESLHDQRFTSEFVAFFFCSFHFGHFYWQYRGNYFSLNSGGSEFPIIKSFNNASVVVR